MAITAVSPRPSGINAVLAQANTFFIQVDSEANDPTPGGATAIRAYNRTSADNGSLVLHSVDPSSGGAADDGWQFSVTGDREFAYTPAGTLVNGSAPEYNVTVFDIVGWIGTSASTPSNTDGNADGSVTWFNNNYYRKDAGAWVFLGGFPNSEPQFTASFSSFTLSITSATLQEPQAFDQTVAVFKNVPKQITHAAVDADGTITGWINPSGPSNGTITAINQDVTYTPNTDYVGSDSYTFRVSDNDGQLSNLATVTINVVSQPTEAPVTQDIALRTEPGTAVSFALLGYDSDGNVASWQVTPINLQGALTGTAPNLTYTPPAGFKGVERISYTATDNDGGVSNTSLIVIRVLEANPCYDGNMIMSLTNLVRTSGLSSNQASATTLDWLKTAETAELTRFASPFASSELTVTAVFNKRAEVNYFAIPGGNLPEGAEVKLDLFNTAAATTASFTSNWYTYGRYEAENNNTFAAFLDQEYPAEKATLTIRHKYPVQTDPGSTLVDDGIARQEANGVLSMEAERGVFENPGNQTYQISSDAGASGSQMVELAASSNFNYSSYAIGPKLVMEFTGTYNGDCNIWLLLRSNNPTDYQIYTNLENSGFGPSQYSDPSLANAGWQWRNIRAVNLEAGKRYRFIVSPRRPNMQIDKLVIQPTSFAQPTGFGPAASPNGTKVVAADGTDTADNTVELRMWMCGLFAQLDKSVAYGTTAQLVTDTDFTRSTEGIASKVDDQYDARLITVSYPNMSDVDRERLAELERAHKGRDDRMLISVYAGASRDEWMRKQYTMLSFFGNALTYRHQFETRHTTGAITLPEA